MHINFEINLAICCSKKRDDYSTRDSELVHRRKGERVKTRNRLPVGYILLGLTVLEGVLKLLTG